MNKYAKIEAALKTLFLHDEAWIIGVSHNDGFFVLDIDTAMGEPGSEGTKHGEYRPYEKFRLTFKQLASVEDEIEYFRTPRDDDLAEIEHYELSECIETQTASLSLQTNNGELLIKFGSFEVTKLK
ncbi:hypothetical protein [Parasphingorhabdus sp.]|uniref:hypothetical protein n=1 Tax=Parasphingorhabdus sp. TaxID=2709688 RepID=UPI003265477A